MTVENVNKAVICFPIPPNYDFTRLTSSEDIIGVLIFRDWLYVQTGPLAGLVQECFGVPS